MRSENIATPSNSTFSYIFAYFSMFAYTYNSFIYLY